MLETSGKNTDLTCIACGSRHLALNDDTKEQSRTAAQVQCGRCKAQMRIEICAGGPDDRMHTIKSTVSVRITMTAAGKPQAKRKQYIDPTRTVNQPQRLPSEGLAAMADELRGAGVEPTNEHTRTHNRTTDRQGPTYRQRTALLSMSGLNESDLVALGAILERLAPECAAFADHPDALGSLSRMEVGGLFAIAQTLQTKKSVTLKLTT